MSRRRDKRETAEMSELERAIARGAILADHSQQAPNNSYSPPDYYQDCEFTCRDCGSEEVWTAEQQKWYYEVAKGSVYAGAVRCRSCRDKIKAEKDLQREQMEGIQKRAKAQGR